MTFAIWGSALLKLADLANRRDFSLGPLRVSPARRQVCGPAGEIHVEPITMQVFLLLVDAKGEVVTRTRLFDEVWGGVSVGDYSLNRAITMVRRIAAETSPGAFEIENIPRTGYRLLCKASHVAADGRPKRLPYAVCGALLFALIAAVLFSLRNEPTAPVPTIAILAEDRDAVSVKLAESVATALVENAVADSPGVHILAARNTGGSRPDFVLTVRRDADGSARKAELKLESGGSNALLWASSLGDRPEARLEDQVRTAGAAVLECAVDANSAGSSAADEATLRLYLRSCSRFEALHGAELTMLADAFANVVAKAPKLRGAWSRLFVSKVEMIDLEIGRSPLSEGLKRDLQRARSLGIDVPEAYLAEGALLPRNARLERLRITEAGLRRYPGNLSLLLGRAWQLRGVGRMTDAAEAAMLAVRKYPRSPAAYTEFANALMFSGRADAARAVLKRASQVAPGSPNIAAARHGLEKRYGDPRHVLAALSAAEHVGDPNLVSYLNARRDPTPENIELALGGLMSAYRADPRDPSMIAQALGEFGQTERAIQLLLEYRYAHVSGDVAEILFRPSLAAVRRDPRFIRIANRFGVTRYWVRSGQWPDFCLDPTLPYSCRTEIARLPAAG